MTLIDQQSRPTDTAIHSNVRPKRGGLIAWLLRWNRAWTAQRRLQRLDATALRDLSLSETQREAISVAQIANHPGD